MDWHVQDVATALRQLETSPDSGLSDEAMAALKKLTVPVVRARRNGRLQEIPAQQHVPATSSFWKQGAPSLQTGGWWRAPTCACRRQR